MGYSCSAAADDALNEVKPYMKEGSRDFIFKGREFFLEYGCEQKDGAITGKVWLLHQGENADGSANYYATKYGNFRVEADGTISHLPPISHLKRD